MKKFIVIAIIFMCLCLYGIIKLSISERQNVNGAAETNQSTKSRNVGDTDVATPSEEKRSAKQINAENTDKATPEEGPGSAVPAVQVEVPAAQVEAVTKVCNEFLSALKSEDYEQAWKLVSESSKSKVSFEKFKEVSPKLWAVLAESTIRPESATNIDGRVGVPITDPSGGDGHLPFIQEDEQWKLELDF
jgi:hypothetical protein